MLTELIEHVYHMQQLCVCVRVCSVCVYTLNHFHYNTYTHIHTHTDYLSRRFDGGCSLQYIEYLTRSVIGLDLSSSCNNEETNTYAYTYVHACTCLFIYMYVCIYVRTYVCVNTLVICSHGQMNLRIYMSIRNLHLCLLCYRCLQCKHRT